MEMTASNDSMATFIASYTQLLVAEIAKARNPQRRAAVRREAQDSSASGSAIDDPMETREAILELDTKVAESLESGTKLFPEPGDQENPDWCVFSKKGGPPNAYPIEFVHSGTIEGASDPERFVSQCYRSILQREVDADGQAAYQPLISKSQLSRRDVIRILADSDEARERGFNLLIIPEPSSWLPRGGSDGTLPSIIDKADL
jgi:hypothetical protein